MGNETIFDVFPTVAYDYLVIDRTGISGISITQEYSANGVFKLRSGMSRNRDQETITQSPTLHIKPCEGFAGDDMVGNGVRVNGVTYEIIGQTNGLNFDTNELEHYTLTLKQSDLS